jgi:plastocyanin domain-containing protein
MKKQNNLLYALAIMLIIVAGGFVVYSQNNNPIVSNSVNEDAQIVKLHVENGNYVLEPNTLKKGIPVRIEADMSRMPGCSKSVVISAFNVRKTVSEGNNLIEFTADKAGTFNIACSMNMYQGTFTVLESDGTKPSYVENKADSTTHTCGTGSGCGCGG